MAGGVITFGSCRSKTSSPAKPKWLQEWDEIVLFFDNDTAGQQATEEVASLLPPGKVKLAALPPDYKDASEALVDQGSRIIGDAIKEAKTFTPGEIVDAKSLYEQIINPEEECLLSTHSKDSKPKLTGSGLGPLQRCVQVLAWENRHSVVNCVLTFSTKENGLDTWHLKKVTVEPLSD